jgi:tetratricopeptide (TPR) repeat protein
MKRFVVPGIPFFFSLALSACTVGSHVYWQDSGYYLTAVRDLTVLYSHGFILYVMFCKAWTLVAAPLLGLTLAVHLFSSFMAAAGASFTALAARDFLRKLDPSKRADLPAIGAACLLGAGYCYGHAAIIAKTYALSYALLALLLWLLVRAERKRDFLALGAVLGLSWAAHPAAALLVPGLLVYGWARKDRIREWGWGFFIGVVALAAAFAFLPCLVLPLLSARESLADLGNPRTLSDLISFVSGEKFTRQEEAFAFSLQRWLSGLRYAAEEYLGAALPLLLGAAVLVRKHRGISVLLAGWIVPVLLVTLLFQGEGQFDQWLVFAYIPMSLLVSVGLSALQDRGTRTVWGVFAAAALSMAALNISLLSQKNYVWAEQYGRLLMKNLDPGSVLFLSRDDPLGICRYLQGLPGERTDVLPLSSSQLGEAWLDRRIERQKGLAVPEYGLLRRMKTVDTWEMVAVAAFANLNIGRVPAVFSDLRPSREFLREDLEIVPAGMLWKIALRGQAGVDLRYWDYPVKPEDIPRKGRRARGHWGYVTSEGTETRSELYEDRFFLPLLWSRVRLADLMLPREPARALKVYESVRDVYPEALRDTRFAYHRGLAFYTSGQPGEAVRAWEELLESKPSPEIGVFVQFYMGELHREAGRPEEAARHYRSALSSSPPPDLKKAIEERLSGR